MAGPWPPNERSETFIGAKHRVKARHEMDTVLAVVDQGDRPRTRLPEATGFMVT